MREAPGLAEGPTLLGETEAEVALRDTQLGQPQSLRRTAKDRPQGTRFPLSLTEACRQCPLEGKTDPQGSLGQMGHRLAPQTDRDDAMQLHQALLRLGYAKPALSRRHGRVGRRQTERTH